MANYRWRSMSKALKEGSTDGRFKDEIPNTDQTAVPGNRAATLRARAGLSRLNGFDWTSGSKPSPGDTTG